MTTGGIKRFRIESLLQHLPPVDHAFAYGSGVFKHFNSRGAGTQHVASVVDYIISVRDPATWHRANLDVNPGHYGALCRACGSGFIAAAADSVGTGVVSSRGERFTHPWPTPILGERPLAPESD